MRISIVVCFGILTFTNVFGQVVGMLGKRLSANVDVNVLPNMGFGNSGSFKWNADPSFGLNYVVGRNAELIMHLNFEKNGLRRNTWGFNLDMPIYNPNTGLTENQTWNANYRFDVDELVSKMRYLSVGIRVYNKKYIAPLGVFHQFTVGVASVRLDGKDEMEGSFISVNNYGQSGSAVDIFYEDFTYPNASFKFYHISYSIGQRKMLNDVLFINYLGGINGFLNLTKATTDGDHNAFSLGIHQKRAHTISRLLEFKLGIGILIF
jgi:hypothetical protein